MKKSAYLPIVVLAGMILSAPGYADVIRVTLNTLKSPAAFQKYSQARAQNNKYLTAQPGFVSITWFSDPKALMAGATTVFKTRESMNAAYDNPTYKAFNHKNIAPYVRARTVHIFNIDQVQ